MPEPMCINRQFFSPLAKLPAVLPGTAIGGMLYRRISDVNFKRVFHLRRGLQSVRSCSFFWRSFGQSPINLRADFLQVCFHHFHLFSQLPSDLVKRISALIRTGN